MKSENKRNFGSYIIQRYIGTFKNITIYQWYIEEQRNSLIGRYFVISAHFWGNIVGIFHIRDIKRNKEIHLLGVILSSVVRFGWRVLVFEADTAWNRGISCKILKFTNQMLFFLLIYSWFSSLNQTCYQR